MKFDRLRFINDMVHVGIGIAVGLGIAYAVYWHQIGAGLAEFARHG